MSRPRKPDAERVRDIAPTGVRLPPPMREALEREAEIHQRSLSAEIIHRLRATLDGSQAPYQPSGALALSQPTLVVADPGRRSGSYLVESAGHLDRNAPPLSDGERMALSLFRAMPPEKQLALLTVLKR